MLLLNNITLAKIPRNISILLRNNCSNVKTPPVNNMVNIKRIITQSDVDKFAEITGDHNPIHKLSEPDETRVIHGALLNGLVSGVVGTMLPGPGTIIISQEMTYPDKCVTDKEISIQVKLIEIRKIQKIAYECKQNGRIVFTGSARLIGPK